MSECFSDFYINNGEVKEKSDFNDEFTKIGKPVYEVIRIIDGVPLFLEKHLSRLRNSLKLVGKPMLVSENIIKEHIEKLIEQNGVEQGNIKLIFNYEVSNNEYIYFIKHSYPNEKMYAEGVNTILYHGERENPNAKVVNINFRETINLEIEKKKAFEAILVDKNGFITEGSKSNIFMVMDNKVITSPVSDVLPGVTRDAIISLMDQKGISFEEKKINYLDIHKVQGLFISGTSPKVLPISKVDGITFDSSNNAVIKRIMLLYDKKIQEYVENY